MKYFTVESDFLRVEWHGAGTVFFIMRFSIYLHLAMHYFDKNLNQWIKGQWPVIKSVSFL